MKRMPRVSVWKSTSSCAPPTDRVAWWLPAMCGTASSVVWVGVVWGGRTGRSGWCAARSGRSVPAVDGGDQLGGAALVELPRAGGATGEQGGDDAGEVVLGQAQGPQAGRRADGGTDVPQRPG